MQTGLQLNTFMSTKFGARGGGGGVFVVGTLGEMTAVQHALRNIVRVLLFFACRPTSRHLPPRQQHLMATLKGPGLDG
jgi:hypothetical protein